jgi:hypothetical protein
MVEEIDNQQQNSVASHRGCLLLILLLEGGAIRRGQHNSCDQHHASIVRPNPERCEHKGEQGRNTGAPILVTSTTVHLESLYVTRTVILHIESQTPLQFLVEFCTFLQRILYVFAQLSVPLLHPPGTEFWTNLL